MYPDMNPVYLYLKAMTPQLLTRQILPGLTAKKLIQKLFPNHLKVKEHRHLQFLGSAIHDPNLWHMNRRSVSGAFAVGLFLAFMPVPGQMVLAALLAVLLRVNLPISVMLVWITNPLTIGPIFYTAYKLGQLIIGDPVLIIEADEQGFSWFKENFDNIWEPLLLGSLLLGAGFSVIGYFGMRLFWRFHVIKRWREKRRQSKRK